jgi:hypothetical protein
MPRPRVAGLAGAFSSVGAGGEKPANGKSARVTHYAPAMLFGSAVLAVAAAVAISCPRASSPSSRGPADHSALRPALTTGIVSGASATTATGQRTLGTALRRLRRRTAQQHHRSLSLGSGIAVPCRSWRTAEVASPNSKLSSPRCCAHPSVARSWQLPYSKADPLAWPFPP